MRVCGTGAAGQLSPVLHSGDDAASLAGVGPRLREVSLVLEIEGNASIGKDEVKSDRKGYGQKD